MTSSKWNLYEAVTDSILQDLEKGTAPWIRPWKGGGPGGFPVNGISGRAYSGINVLLLWKRASDAGYASKRWYTYKQVGQLGARLHKGEAKQWTRVVFAPMLEKEDAKSGEKKQFRLLRYYRVYNASQVDGLEEQEPEVTLTGVPSDILRDSGVSVRHGFESAFYCPSTDQISLPSVTQFRSEGDYWATALHELIHATSHPSRLDRSFGDRFDQDARAMEELVAEIGSAFLCASAGVELTGLQHSSYIQSWLERLRKDRYAIFTACRHAKAASEFLLSRRDPAATGRPTLQAELNSESFSRSGSTGVYPLISDTR